MPPKGRQPMNNRMRMAAIQYAIGGMTKAEIRHYHGVSTATITQWFSRPDFLDELDNQYKLLAQDARMDAIRGRAQAYDGMTKLLDNATAQLLDPERDHGPSEHVGVLRETIAAYKVFSGQSGLHEQKHHLVDIEVNTSAKDAAALAASIFGAVVEPGEE